MRHLLTLLALLFATSLAAVLWHYIYRQHTLKPRSFKPFPLMLGVAVLCRVAFLLLTPTFYAPDEQSHYHHVKFIATHGEFAIQTTKLGDPSNEWEHNQPPLYYVLLTPFYWFSNWIDASLTTSIWLMRSFSLFLWCMNVWFAITLLNRLNIIDRVVRTFCLGLICLLPTYTFSSTAINNDNLLAMLGTGLLCWLSRRQYTKTHAAMAGLLLGLSLLTKQSAIVLLPVLGFLLLMELRQRTITGRTFAAYSAISFGLAFLTYLPWAMRNLQVYHTLTPEMFVVDTIKWPSFIYGVASAAHNLMKSFWAVAGIANDINYPFPIVGMLLLAICIGAGQIGLKRRRSIDCLHSEANGPLLAAMWIGLAVNILLVLRFGYLFGMGQGRHLLPLLIPIALLLGNWLSKVALTKLSAHCAGAWIVYALTFTAFSLSRFPR